jgi:hypothetical protein
MRQFIDDKTKDSKDEDIIMLCGDLNANSAQENK